MMKFSSEETKTAQEPYWLAFEPCHVEFVDKMGSDLRTVNAARTSFGIQSQSLTAKDEKLIQYLGSHEHYSPFRHNMLCVVIEAPEFVMRQLYKHCVGIEATSSHPTKDHAWSEVSSRFRPMRTIYVPSTWYRQHESAKQCSGTMFDSKDQPELTKVYTSTIHQIMTAYDALLALGVSREQARTLLPLSFMTTVMWTASLQAIYHFVRLRDHPDAQEEIRVLAQELEDLACKHFPLSYAALKASHSQ